MKTTLRIAALATLAAAASAQQQTVLHASDAAARDAFGSSVSVSGGTIIVGASLDNITGNDQGSAYVFVGSGPSWAQQAKLVPLDMQANAFFGSAVSLSGESAAVGSPNSFLTQAGASEGSAYVFLRNGTAWAQQAKVTANDAAVGDMFGSALALDGDTLAVGAPLRDDLGGDAGGVYVFVRSGTNWTQQAKLLASDGTAGDHFGAAIALSGDTLVVGAPSDDGTSADSGSAYVFVRTGTVWSQQAKVTASDALGGDAFGRSVAVSGDTLVSGANLRNQQGVDSGAAYVFARSGTAWSQQVKLAPNDGANYAYFGNSVAIASGTILVGACQAPASGPSSGAAYVFHGGSAGWFPAGKLLPTVGAAGDFFGISVSVSGTTAATGGPSSDDVAWNAGSAYIFTIASPGAAFCSGDGTLSTQCPCTNTGLAGRGCQNSAGTGGARLESSGTASLSGDSLTLTSSGELPTVLSIFLQGTSSIASGSTFGDGLRCVGGALKRLGSHNASGGIVVYPSAGDSSVSLRSAALGDVIVAGSTRWYQTYYRDPVLGFCSAPQGNSWNISSGQVVTWAP